MRLQSNKLKQLGRTIAREQLLKQLDEVDAAGMQNLTWKQGPAWRRKADILADLRRCPNAGIFQVTQLWLFLDIAGMTIIPDIWMRNMQCADQGREEG